MAGIASAPPPGPWRGTADRRPRQWRGRCRRPSGGSSPQRDRPAIVGLGLRVVAALVVDQVGRVGGHRGGPLPGHQPPHLAGVRAIAAEQPVVAQQPEIAGFVTVRLGARAPRRGRPGQPLPAARGAPGERSLEQAAHRFVFALDRGQQLLQLGAIGRRPWRRSGRGSPARGALRLGELDEQAGQLALPALPGKLDAQVSVDQVAGRAC